MASEGDDLPPDLEDMTEQVTALSQKVASASDSNSNAVAAVSRELLSAGAHDLAPEVAERLVIDKMTGGKPKSKEELQKSEFLTDWGTPEQEAMQKQMLDAALAAAPEVVKEKAEQTQNVTQEFMKGTAVKKGFLLGGSSKKATPSSSLSSTSGSPASKAKGAASKASEEEIIELKPTGNRSSSLRLTEVQDAINADVPAMRAKLSDGSWMTPDLLAKVAKEPRLVMGMQNPRYMAALNETGKSPQSTMEKYKSDSGLQDFLRAFMGLLGEHFSELGAKEKEEEERKAKGAGASAPTTAAAASSSPGITPVASRPLGPSAAPRASLPKPGGILADERASAKEIAEAARKGALPGVDEEVREVLSQAEVVETLRDPAVQRAMEECRLDGSKLKAVLANPVMRKKFQVLQRAGLIRIEM